MTSIKELADAVVAELNDAGFAQAFTAVRDYVPTFTPDDLADLRVVVAPGGIESTRASRGASTVRYKIDVGILKRVDNDAGQIDDLIDLVDEIRRFIDGRELERLPAATMTAAATIDPLYVPEELRQNRVFASVIRLTYFLA